MNKSNEENSKGSSNPAVGATHKGSFHCEARSFCPLGDSVWVGERSGLITLRNARNGDVQHTIDPSNNSKKGFFATVMRVVNGEMWIGTSDGRLCVFDTVTLELTQELLNPETEKGGEIYDLSVDGNCIFAAMSTCRVAQWDTRTKAFVKNYLHEGPVRGAYARNHVLFSGDDTGVVCRWDVQTGERTSASKESLQGVTAMIHESSTRSLWVARMDGKLDVYATDEELERIDTISDAKSRINTLMQVGGKVWGAGVEKTMFVWHAYTRKLIGKVKDHTAFIFALGKLYTMETARIWSLSNDKSVNIYDAEGFFSPVKGNDGFNEEISELHQTIQSLRMDNATLEKRVLVEKDKVDVREIELERLRSEVQQVTLKLHAIEHVVTTKEETIHLHTQDHSKLYEETQNLTKRVGELTLKLNEAEQEKATLRGDIARAEEELARTRTKVAEKTSQFSVVDTERTALAQDKGRLLDVVKAKDEDNTKLGDELRKLRDQLNVRMMEITRKELEQGNMKDRVAAIEKERDSYVQKCRALDDARRRLEDTIVLRESENKELLQQLGQVSQVKEHTHRELMEVSKVRDVKAAESQRIQDNYVLRNHEFTSVKEDRDSLSGQLEHQKAQAHEARNVEVKLRLQNDELSRQLETEKNNVKMLQDQYTIFQFVINSRGELVSSIWNLLSKCNSATKTLGTLEQNVKSFDPTKEKIQLKREWRTSIVEHTKGSVSSIADVQKMLDYIVANYFSEYEKLHLGINSTKYKPDANRPPIVGDQLLTKLRDVTLMKQSSQPNNASALPKPLPPPHQQAYGQSHSVYASRIQGSENSFTMGGLASGMVPPMQQQQSGVLPLSQGNISGTPTILNASAVNRSMGGGATPM